MIDNFALLLSHGLMLFAAWRLLSRPDLDDATLLPPQPGPTKGRAGGRFRKAARGA